MRRAAYVLVVAVAALAVGTYLATRDVTPGDGASAAPAVGSPGSGAAAGPRPPVAGPPGPPAATPFPFGLEAASPAPLLAYPVDLARLRSQLPGNLYWETGEPTSDPEVAKRRAAREQDLNTLYGKVLSGTGTEEEVRSYFEQKRREHEDAIRFAQGALAAGGDRLPERDRGMFLLAIELHEARLAEAPARLAEALARKAEQDRRRAAWKAAGSPVPP